MIRKENELKLDSGQFNQLSDGLSVEDNDIGHRLRELRGDRTQREIAFQLKGRSKKDQKTGDMFSGRMTEAGYNKIEKGHSKLSYENAVRLAKYYGVPVNYILYGQSENDDMVQMFKQDDRSAQFILSLGIRQYNTKLVRYLDETTGDYISFWESDKDISGTKEVTDLIKSIVIGSADYDIDFEKWDDIIAIAMDTARATIEAACKRYDRKDIKEDHHGKHN